MMAVIQHEADWLLQMAADVPSSAFMKLAVSKLAQHWSVAADSTCIQPNMCSLTSLFLLVHKVLGGETTVECFYLSLLAKGSTHNGHTLLTAQLHCVMHAGASNALHGVVLAAITPKVVLKTGAKHAVRGRPLPRERTPDGPELLEACMNIHKALGNAASKGKWLVCACESCFVSPGCLQCLGGKC